MKPGTNLSKAAQKPLRFRAYEGQIKGLPPKICSNLINLVVSQVMPCFVRLCS